MLFLLAILTLVALVAAGVFAIPAWWLVSDYVAAHPRILFAAFGLYLVAHCLYWFVL